MGPIGQIHADVDCQTASWVWKVAEVGTWAEAAEANYCCCVAYSALHLIVRTEASFEAAMALKAFGA